jgi:hypothetical protein
MHADRSSTLPHRPAARRHLRPAGTARLTALLCACLVFPAAAQEEGAAALLARYDRFPHAEVLDQTSKPVLDHVVGLGPMQKVRGDWRLEDSERLTGRLTSYTWRIVDGFSSRSLFEDAATEIEALPGSELLYACEARSCGRSVQWANRVFHQRLLYGTESSQRYRVYALRGGEQEQRLVIYASARTSDRQYLHMELVTLREEGSATSEGQPR